MTETFFTQWALLGGLIFNAGYVVSIVRQYNLKKSCISEISFILFAIATMGYIGYFIMVKPDIMMARIAIVGLSLICFNIAQSIFYGSPEEKTKGGLEDVIQAE